MNRWFSFLLFVLLGSQTACTLGQQAKDVPCHGDTVQESPGVVLALSSGQTYQVFPADNRISMMWLPLDRLSVCPIGGAGVEITNVSERGEQVRALRVFNWFFDDWGRPG